jgi:Icc-related predicted phosphoesterase
MKVKVLSDLHLEFSKPDAEDLDPGTGDVLILAGDICDAVAFVHRCDEELRGVYTRFFKRCVLGYDKVFYVMGNHEHYNGVFSTTADILRNNLPEGVTLLDNNSEFYNGWHFVGATMWSDFGKGDEKCKEAAQNGLNDYHAIFQSYDTCETINTNFIQNENRNTIEWFKQCLPTLNGPVFVVTHHCPTFQSIDEDYTGSGVVTAYASDFSDLIEQHPNVLYWAHGHVHSSKRYTVGNCVVLSNPKGYPSEINPDFDVNFSLEL